MREFSVFPLLLAGLLLLAGCSNGTGAQTDSSTQPGTASTSSQTVSSQNTAQSGQVEQRIETFLVTFFTAPDEKLLELSPKLKPNPQDPTAGDTALGEYKDYLKTLHSPEDFTEKFYDEIADVMLQSMVFPTFCVEKNAQLEPESMQVEKKTEVGEVYTYTAKLILTKDGTTSTITQEGTVQTDETGKISHISPEVDEIVGALLK